jgi:hypothetical protein
MEHSTENVMNSKMRIIALYDMMSKVYLDDYTVGD